jgi:protein-L-isoaspartate(D-aspartate) O-methyltransferase
MHLGQGLEETRMGELQKARERFGEKLRSRANLHSDAVIRAFEQVGREHFLGPGPWRIMNLDGSYWWTPDANPRHIYDDVLVAIDADRKLNNGQPSGLACVIEALALQQVGHVVHLVCRTGYYTAIMSHLVGEYG